jgi:hypothetical protein
VLSQEPDAFITIYTFDKNDSMMTGKASNRSYPGRARLIQCNFGDALIVAVGGENMLKLMNKTEKGFGQLGTIKGENITATPLTWLSAEHILAVSADMELYFVEGGELKAKSSWTWTSLISARHRILKTGFAFATHNMVNVFYEESTFKYVKKILLSISVTQSA